jgi:hypothetical protein
MKQEQMTKVALFAPDGRIETVWAADIGEGRFQLRNLPFYAFGLALDDIFTVAPSSAGFPMVADVVERSGHSSYRLFLREGRRDDDFNQAWAPLAAAGCVYEHATSQLIAVDVPPATDLDTAYRLLEAGLTVWDLEEAYAHLAPSTE